MNAVAERDFDAAVTPTVTASSTTVSATLKDQGGTIWSGAQITVNFAPAPNIPGPYMWGGSSFTLRPQITADANGHFSISLPDNLTITPAGSMWQFVIAPSATMPAVVFQLMAVGSAMDISTVFTSQSYQLSTTTVQSLAIPRAYGDAAVITPPNSGQIYFNTTTSVIEFWNGSKWLPLVGASTMPGGEDVSALVVTGTYMWTNTPPAHNYPNPTTPPFDPRHSVLEVWNLNAADSVTGPSGYAIQRMTGAADWQNGRFYIRTYSDIGTPGTFGWTQWLVFTSTATAPPAP
jgi:hypothetical protein